MNIKGASMLKFEQFIDEKGNSTIYLNTNDLFDKADISEHTETFKKFYVMTYELLRNREDQSADETQIKWDTVFKPVNDFFLTLDREEQVAIAQTLMSMHFDILENIGLQTDLNYALFSKKIDKMTESLKTMLGDLDQKINLIPKLINFVEKNIPIINFDNVGMKPEDTPEMTFERPDIVILTSIVVLCKMLSPIFGSIINYTSKQINNDLKVFHCYAILTTVLSRRYLYIYNKLMYYLTNIIKPFLKSNDITFAFHAYTLQMLTIQAFAYLLTRRFIPVDIYQKNGNLMTYTLACVKSYIKTLNSSTTRKSAIKEKEDPKEINSDEGNSSRLENESKNSKTTADVPIIVEFAAEWTINKLLEKCTEEEKEIYEKSINYYTKNLVTPTMFNKYIVSIFYGSSLAGATGIELLTYIPYVKLITMLQIQLYKLGFHSLICPLTMNPLNTIKLNLSDSDRAIKLNWHSIPEFKMCDQLFIYNCNDLTWDTILADLVLFLIEYNYAYHLSPELWKYMNLENHNTEEVFHNELIFKDIYNLIRYVVNREEIGYSSIVESN
jgi:hypothetical protein